ncbi:MAG: T9SS type A sorting domain-containing protein [Flavobacteriales bacterium]
MNKKIIATIALMGCAISAKSQSIEWMHDAGSTPFSANEHGDAVDADADGNAYVLGHLTIDSQFSGLPVPAHQDGCLAKYDATGVVQWVKTFGGPGFVDMLESTVKVSTADNAVYVCGRFRTQFANPNVNFDTDTFTYVGNSLHAFLAKYDLNGNFQWMRHGGGTPYGAGFNDLDIADDGSIVCVGVSDGLNVFDGDTLQSAGSMGIIARYLPNGTLVDLLPLADGLSAEAVEVAPVSGHVFVGGAFIGTVNVNGVTATSPLNTYALFVMKMDDALQAQWISTGGGDNSTYGSWLQGLAIDAAENCYITGEASGNTISFGPHSFTGHTFYDDEVITAKVDAAGAWQWLRRGGSEQNDEALDIIADAQGNTVITGYLGGNIPYADFDGIQVDIVSQSAHCFIARYDPYGQIIYAERMGGGSDDAGFGLALANDSTFYLTGTTWGSTPWLNWNFTSCCADPNLFITKIHDVFSGLVTAVDVVDHDVSGLSLHPNPVSDLLIASDPRALKDIRIYNTLGEQKRLTLQSGAIDVSTWANGVYFAVIPGFGPVSRIVIQH